MQLRILPLFALLASGTLSFAQSEPVDDLLANTATFKPRITMSDVYAERVDVDSSDGVVVRNLVAVPQRLSASVTANLGGIDVGPINEDTEVGLTAWKFSHSDVLGSAEDYKPGARRATFPYYATVDLPNGDTKEVRVGSIIYAWTAKTLTVTLNITDAEAAGVGDIAASDYTSVADPGQRVAIVDDPVEVSVTFGTGSGRRAVFLRGFARCVTRVFGTPTSDDYETFDLTDVNLQGAADVTAPVLTSVFPAKPAPLSEITVTGTARDLQTVDLLSATVNGVAVNSAVFDLGEVNASGAAPWSVTGIPLRRGANNIVLTFTDPDGNTARVTRSYTLR